MQRIMVAIDGSDGANRALDSAAHLAKDTGAELIILNVGGEISSAELRTLATTGGSLRKRLKDDAAQILKKARNRIKRRGLKAVQLICEWGAPVDTIIATAKREKVDTLVVGRRGRGPLSGLLLGSVSQNVASLAPCTVIVVP